MPTDWPAILPELQADTAEGLTVRQIAAKRGLPHGSVARWLRRGRGDSAIQADGESKAQEASQRGKAANEGDEKAEVTSKLPPPIASQLEIDREAARKAMRDGLSGKVELTAQQTALIKLLLKDELEPETERNLYAGRSTDELGERALVLSVSVLGVVKVAAKLRELAKAGTLDLGLDWTPETREAPAAMPESEGPATVETLEDVPAAQASRPVGVASAAPSVTADLGGVQSVDG